LVTNGNLRKIKMMLPNPYVEVDKETVEFPVLSDEIKIAD
jgi:hypothetical protein